MLLLLPLHFCLLKNRIKIKLLYLQTSKGSHEKMYLMIFPHCLCMFHVTRALLLVIHLLSRQLCDVCMHVLHFMCTVFVGVRFVYVACAHINCIVHQSHSSPKMEVD